MNKKVCHITSAHNRYDVTLVVNDNEPDEINKGVKIVSTKFKPRNRAERFLKSHKLLLAKAIEVDADIYHLHDPDLLPIGNKLNRKGKKIIFDSHEDVPNQIIDKSWIPSIMRGIISKVYSIYEKSSLKNYNAVISVTPRIIERLSKINPNTVMVTNYPIIKSDSLKHEANSNSICFAGGITKQYYHENIILAIEHIDNVKYILAGNSSEEYLNKLRSLQGWDKVEF